MCDNNKMDHKDVAYQKVDYTHLAYVRAKWRSFATMVTNGGCKVITAVVMKILLRFNGLHGFISHTTKPFTEMNHYAPESREVSSLAERLLANHGRLHLLGMHTLT